MKKIRKGRVLLAFLFLLWGGDVNAAAIRDLQDLSQKPTAYLDWNTADTPLVSVEDQGLLNAAYDDLHFAPWRQSAPRHTLDQVSWGFREYGSDPGYGKDGRRHSRDWIRKMAVNAHLDDYPCEGFPAVTVKRTDFRVLPTRETHSRHPKQVGRDYPFDNLQESSVPLGTPLLVTQVSRDRKWLLAETSFALGWIPATDAAAVDHEFMRNWECGRYAVVIKDKSPVRDEKGALLFTASLGSIYPKIGEEGIRTGILSASRNSGGNAVIRKAWLPKSAATDKPLSFTPRHVAHLAAELAGDAYGWGGMDGKRDCSSLIRDLFAPFGLWLPRNSSEQAETGRFMGIRRLAAAEKEAFIVRQGAPWRTLLWTPGHIMLYIGVHHGRPLVFHNFWSVRTRDADGKKGRVIVGRAAVTTLQPGRELSGQDLPRTDVEGITLLGELPIGNIMQPGAEP